MNNWYTTTKPTDLQGQVAEETTGKTIAVTYDAKHAALVAAAPEMLKALKLVENIMPKTGIESYSAEEWEAARAICDAIRQAEGN